MYIYFSLSGLFNAITTLVLGVVVLRNSKGVKANRLFAYLCFGFAAWSFPYVMWPLAKSKEQALFWFQILHIGAIYIPLYYYSFVTEWLGRKSGRDKFLLVIGYILAIFFTPIVFTNLFIEDMSSRLGMNWWAVPGIAYHFYLLYFFFYYIYSSILLYIGYRKSSGIKKYQIKYVLMGIIIAIAGGSTNYFLWYDIPIKPYGNIFASSIVIVGAYAIIRYRLLDINLIFRNLLINLISLVFSLGMVFAFFNLLIFLFPKHNDLILVIVVSALSIIVHPLVKKVVDKFINKYFFASINNPQEIISNISHELQSTLDIGIIHKTIYEKLDKAFRFKSFGIFSTDKEKGKYKFRYGKNINQGNCKFVKFSNFFNNVYLKKGKQILIEELKNTGHGRNLKKDIDLLVALDVDLIIPLRIKDDAIGFIAMGEKEDGGAYTKDDLSLLDLVSIQAATAIDNARLYQEVAKQREALSKQKRELKDLNNNLNDKVREQTADIQKKSEYLEGLLNMKNDFLRVVNHQLNTPISIMRNAYAMVEEKVYKPKEGLDMAGNGLRRISETVADFLSAFELEGETMKVEPERTNVVDIINRIVAEKNGLKEMKDKRLFVAVKESNVAIPEVFCDPKKIVHVVSNLLDNAIFYTEKGGVTVYYDLAKNKSSDYLRICVKDTGVGIKKEDQDNLFKKFSRGSQATNLHPDGSGLGTYIAKKIAEANGGSLVLEKTEIGKGSVFCFSLPVYKGQKAGRKIESTLNKDAIDAYNRSKEKEMREKNRKIAKELQPIILLVEDEKNLADIYHKYFTKKGFRFFVSDNINEAMTIARNIKPDVILLDIIIPKKMADGSVNTVAEQGYDFLDIIKKDASTKNIPVLMFSNLDSDRDRKKSADMGAAGYLVKAKVEPRAVIEKIEEVI